MITAGLSGALRVIEGTLAERYVTGRSLPTRHRRINADEGISFEGDYAHDVVNLDEPCATSIHVYSSASRPMSYYRVTDDGLSALPARADDATVIEDDPGYEDEAVAAGGSDQIAQSLIA